MQILPLKKRKNPFRRRIRRGMAVLNSRRGVALILTIGILALLLVLAMSFAFASVHAQRTTAYSVDLTNARLQAETGLQTVINMMKSELVDSDDYNNFYPGTKLFVVGTGDWDGFDFLVSMVDTSGTDTQMTDGLLDAVTHEVNDLTYIPNSTPTGTTIADTSVNAVLAANFSWIPVYKDKEFDIGTDSGFVDVIDGRYGFILIDESGKIDPNTAVDDSYAEGAEAVSFKRQGYYLSEVSLLDLGFDSTFAAKLRSNGAGGLQPANAKWFSRYHIARITGLTGSPGQSVLDTMNATLFPYRRPDTISNQTDVTADNTPVTFDLRLTSNGGDIATSTGANGADILAMANASVGNHPGIPYIRGWQDRGDFVDPGDRYWDVSARALNLMCNIKDYIDTDHEASHDSDGLGSNPFPNYWGVEAVPSLSRMLIKVENTTQIVWDSGSSRWDITPELTVTFRPELLNNFGDISSYCSNARIIIYYMVGATMHDGSGYLSGVETTDITNFASPTSNAGAEGTAALSASKWASSGYMQWISGGIQKVLTPGVFFDDIQDSQKENYSEMDNVRIYISRIVVLERDTNSNGYEDEEKWDFAMPCEVRTGPAEFLPTVATLDSPLGVAPEAFWHLEAYSPLNNHYPGDWQRLGPFTDENGFTGKTMEQWWTDPKTTIYIRDGEMESLSELGLIMRMDPADTTDTTAAFATFNLIDYYYNGATHYRTEAEDGITENYDTLDASNAAWQQEEGNGGDRNLLDYVRIGPTNAAERELIGRININTRREEVLEALFNRLVGATTATNETITQADVDTMVAHILDKTFPDLQNLSNDSMPKLSGPLPLSALNDDSDAAYDPDDANYFLSSPVRYRNPPLYGLLFQPTDSNLKDLSESKLEYMLVHTMQLVNARHNYFTCVVTAQAIKDVGSIYGVNATDQTINGIPSRLSRWDDGADTILAEQKVRVVLYRDCRSNKITVERFDYLDE